MRRGVTVTQFSLWSTGLLGCYAAWNAAGILAIRTLGVHPLLWLLATPLLLWLGAVLLTAAGPTARRTLARLSVAAGCAAILALPAIVSHLSALHRG